MRPATIPASQEFSVVFAISIASLLREWLIPQRAEIPLE
jgi:hypothetical protein